MEQKGVTAWFTGLSGCGKSTVADLVDKKLKEQGYLVERLDGDIVRQSLTKDLGFSKEDRNTNIERVTFVAKLLTRNKVIVLATFISPYIERRNKTREEIGSFLEIFVDCPLEECEARDVKGMYQKAREGIIKEFTGISDPYEAPPSPELVLYTKDETVEESADKVIVALKNAGYLA